MEGSSRPKGSNGTPEVSSGTPTPTSRVYTVIYSDDWLFVLQGLCVTRWTGVQNTETPDKGYGLDTGGTR